jgi:hypothetical protein
VLIVVLVRLIVVLTLVAGCEMLTAPAPTHEIVVTVFNESHDAASIAVLNHDQLPVGVATPPVVAGASHADILLRVPISGEWGLWINHGEPGAGMIIGNADTGGCTGRLPIQIRVGPDRNLSWNGQPFC